MLKKVKKYGILCVSTCILFGLTACSNTAEEPVTSTPPTQTSETQPSEEATDAEPSEEIQSDAKFALSPEEKTLYDAYIQNLDVKVFENAEPISVVKVFIQCGIDRNYEAEYGMFLPGNPEETKEEYIASFDGEESTSEQIQELANGMFGLLDKGKFVSVSDKKGHVAFQNIVGQEGKFQIEKDENGIWRILWDYLGE